MECEAPHHGPANRSADRGGACHVEIASPRAAVSGAVAFLPFGVLSRSREARRIRPPE